MDNLKIWDKLSKTDPSHTKKFKRSGGFEGTAIKPMFSYKRMTEEFGPCGIGWGVDQPSFQVVNAGDEILVYCTVSIWYNGDRDMSVFGVGGDKVVNKFSSGLKSDDEAFKKAYTDAVTNALKLIGVGADVHMGLFDDNKYVNEMKAEYSDAKAAEPEYNVEKSRSNEMVTMIYSKKDRIELDSYWDEIQTELKALPTQLLETVEQAYGYRCEQINNGVTPIVKHTFAGVKDATAWLIRMKPVVDGFKSSKLLLEWQTDNQPFINGLDILKAEKDRKEGKLPKERFTDLLAAKYLELSNIELSQTPLAAE